jgi:hypothetical protein
MLKKLKPLLDKIPKNDKKSRNEVLNYCACIPIVGFNSGGYDINNVNLTIHLAS